MVTGNPPVVKLGYLLLLMVHTSLWKRDTVKNRVEFNELSGYPIYNRDDYHKCVNPNVTISLVFTKSSVAEFNNNDNKDLIF